ncbi:MAG: Hsp70 family protein, partial [Ferruginibacter sp.]
MGKIGINIVTGSLQQADIIVGIDLGTTNSLIAVIHPESGKPTVLKEHDGNALVPSVLYFDHHGQVIVGDAAKAHLETEPERTIFS